MILIDVNVLVYAHRENSTHHGVSKKWLLKTLNTPSAFGLSDMVLSGFIRIVTHPRIFTPTSTHEQAFSFAQQVRENPNAVLLSPGQQHWGIFEQLCKKSGASGNLVADAYLAALAIESGSEFITFDRDYSRFPGLKWSTPE